MKKIKFLLIAVLFINQIYGQHQNKFDGFIKLQDTLFIKYKIEFNESNGKVSGFSITDFGGEHETKSRITGNYDEENKQISFKEVEMVYTKSPVSLDDFDFCNVKFTSKRFKLGSDKMMGSFNGFFNDGTKCLDGDIAMSTVEKIQQRVSKLKKKVNKFKRIPDSLKEKMAKIKVVDTLNLNVLKKNEVTSVPTRSKTIRLFIYDGGKVDNDIITVFKDDKPILKRYKISTHKKVIDVPIVNSITRIKILSDSVGTIGSNTAIIEVFDGNNLIKTMTNLKKGESTLIDILKKIN